MGLFKSQAEKIIGRMERTRNISGLNTALQDSDREMRWRAASSLDYLTLKGVHARSSIEPLNNALYDIDDDVRENAASALGNLTKRGIYDWSSIEPLNSVLHDPEINVRILASCALGNLAEVGVCDKSSFEPLYNALRDSDGEVREWAASALESMDTYIEEESEKQKQEDTILKAKENSEMILSSSIELMVPNHLDPDTTAEIIVQMTNQADYSLQDISIDFSMLDKFFLREGHAYVEDLLPGMTLKKTVKFKPKFEEGVFPVKITITGCGVAVEKEYTIKVGGTEIY